MQAHDLQFTPGPRPSRRQVRLRQSYLHISKCAAMMASRYAHAKQFKRHHRLLRSRLGRIIRDIRRKITGRPELKAVFEVPIARAAQIRSQQQRQRGCYRAHRRRPHADKSWPTRDRRECVRRGRHHRGRTSCTCRARWLHVEHGSIEFPRVPTANQARAYW